MLVRVQNGTDQFYKCLIPEALPRLESTNLLLLSIEGKLEPELTDRKIANINKELDDAVLEYKDKNQGLQSQYKLIEESKTKINELMARRQVLIRDYGRNAVEIADIERRIENNKETIKLSEEAIIELLNITLPNIQTDINELNRKLDENEENKK